MNQETQIKDKPFAMQRSVLHNLVLGLGKRTTLVAAVLVVVGLNIYWSLTLSAFGAQFETVARTRLLDLANVGSILSVEEAAALLDSYGAEARSLYFQFFVLDNLMPPIVFGAIAVLWVALLKNRRAPIAKWFLRSPLLLAPFGVGLFDVLENLTFVSYLAGPQAGSMAMLQAGLVFVRIKAAFLFTSFGLTAVVLVLAIVFAITERRRAANPTVSMA
ncbi:MAG: hypothetical protein ACLFP4_08355 [Spirochaetales bacterium]